MAALHDTLEKLRAPTNVAWEVRFQTSSVSGLSAE
jgi:hypothetical protein